MGSWVTAHSNEKPEMFQKAGNDKYLLHQNIVENTDEDYVNKLYDLSPDEIKYIEYYMISKQRKK